MSFSTFSTKVPTFGCVGRRNTTRDFSEDIGCITQLHFHRWKHDYLIPWNEYGTCLRPVWTALELQSHRTSTVD